ncbi:hypothetical protein F5B20DRAFT_467826 [Whalleya microplaca]|nr:hypothetical protein F5B20DRAFT_467826 [Whalleya microplaca]
MGGSFSCRVTLRGNTIRPKHQSRAKNCTATASTNPSAQSSSSHQHHHNLLPSLSSDSDEYRAGEILAWQREGQRLRAVRDGADFLHHFLRTHFGRYLGYIQLVGAPTLDQIKLIGNEADQQRGTRACRRLFNAPVLSDEVGHLLWRELRQGAALDHSHERGEFERELERAADAAAAEWEAGERRAAGGGYVVVAVDEVDPDSSSIYDEPSEKGSVYGEPLARVWNTDRRPSFLSDEEDMSSSAAYTTPRAPTPEAVAEAGMAPLTRMTPPQAQENKRGGLFGSIRKRMAKGLGSRAG